jgi:hypothetical protein
MYQVICPCSAAGSDVCLPEFAKGDERSETLRSPRFSRTEACRVENSFIGDQERPMKIAGVIAALIGVILLGLGGYLFVQEQLFLQTAEQATAVVTGNERHTYQSSEYGEQHYYCSEFQFQTRDGQSVSFQESDSATANCANLDSPPDYQEGQKVAVYYDPGDPIDSVQIPKSIRLDYDGAVILAVAGTLALLVGLGLFWFGFLRGRRLAPSGSARR